MTDGSARDSLPQFLARRARGASDGRLAFDAAAGLIAVAMAATVIRSSFNLILAAAGTCFLAFGLWGIADRELVERHPTIGPIGGGLLVAVRAFAGALGVIGGLGLIFGGLAVALGTWIS
jgi:hypothetical protein